jgi:hypothetical protein
MSNEQSFGGDVAPKGAISNLPSYLTAELFGNARQSTPPPIESPQPRTPQKKRFANPPRTPISKTKTLFGSTDDLDDDDDVDVSRLHAGMAIKRPSSACSTYSCSSDSSVDSNTTYYSTTGGSCTSVEDEDVNIYETSKTQAPDADSFMFSAASERRIPETKGKGKAPQKSGRARKTKWTETMDVHLWTTYNLYKSNPQVTPFYVLPGQVPPLGVCYRVARETKHTWKAAKLNGDHINLKSPVPKTKARLQPLVSTNNRGDSLRKATPFSWPASESATRRRLRELCRKDHDGERNPYHNHQRARVGEKKVRNAAFGEELAQFPDFRDPFSTTRNMALSLTTSTASSMRPSAPLAVLTSGRDIFNPPSTPRPFGSIIERLESVAPDTTELQNILGAASSLVSLSAPRRAHSRQLSLDSIMPSLLPPLELKTLRSPYGTWPGRLKRPEQDETEADTEETLPPQKTRRGTLGDLFAGERSERIERPEATTTAQTQTQTQAKPIRTRTRGHTVSSGSNPLGNRRRSRVAPLPPLLTVTTMTGTIGLGWDALEGEVLAAARGGSSQLLPRPRLGSPFAER